MKIIAFKEHDEGYILEASRAEVGILAEIEKALEGQTHNDANIDPPGMKLRLPDHEKMVTILLSFLYAVRDHNDFAASFKVLKGLLKEANNGEE